MSIEKIKQLNQIATQIEEMKKNAISEVKDREELRVQALKKIQEYFRDLSKATEGCYWRAETPITIYWLVKEEEIRAGKKNGVCFVFDKDGKVNIVQYASASTLRIDDFTNLTEFGRQYSHGFRWEDGMIELINKWKELKPYIEKEAEKAMLSRMTKAQDELANFKTSYELVANFEI